MSLITRGVPVSEEIGTEDSLGKAMKEENLSCSLGFRDPVRLGRQAWGGAKITVMRFKVYEIEDAIKVIKEGIQFGGKMSSVEEFKGQLRSNNIINNNSPWFSVGPSGTDEGVCFLQVRNYDIFEDIIESY